MGDPDQENVHVDMQTLQEDTENAKILSDRMSEIKYTDMNVILTKGCKQETENLLKGYINYYLLLQKNVQNKDEFGARLAEFEIYMNDILYEWKKILFNEKRQSVFEKIQHLKNRLFAVTTSDTCTHYLKTLFEDADKLKKELERDKHSQRFPDIYQDLKRLILKISSARQNTKMQVWLEATTAVLTLGASPAGGALGAVAAAERSATLAAKGVSISAAVASKAAFAGKCVSTVANITIEAVNVGSAISNSLGCNENTSNPTLPLDINERFVRLYSVIKDMIKKRNNANINVEEIALLIFNEMTKDEIDKLSHP